jgi:hypothetical protein
MRCRRQQGAIAAFIVAAVAAGIILGFCAARVARAWRDEETHEARQRFYDLYADPTGDIDDLPAQMPMCAPLCMWLVEQSCFA